MIEKYRHSENVSHRNVKIFSRTVNPPTEYKQFIKASSHMVKITSQ
jgi:hypothetical protein